MNKPPALRFIAIAGVVLEVIVYGVSHYSFTQRYGAGPNPIVTLLIGAAWIALVGFIYFKLYQVRNWARVLVLLYSALSVVPVPWPWISPIEQVVSYIAWPFYVFFLVYLLRSEARSLFTSKPRKTWKVVLGTGFVLVVWLGALGVSQLGQWLGEYIDYEQLLTSDVESMTSLDDIQHFLTPKGWEAFRESQEEKRAEAEGLLDRSLPEEYLVQQAREFDRVNYVTLVDTDWTHMLVLITSPDLRDRPLDEAVRIFSTDSELRDMLQDKNVVSYGAAGKIRVGESDVPVIEASYGEWPSGYAGKVDQRNGGLVFLILPQKGKEFQASSLAWLYE